MKKLTFLQLNDLHGYLEPHPEVVRRGEAQELRTLGGLARIAGLFGAVRAETGGAVVALDNGDTFHGTNMAVRSKGRAMLPAMNALGLDAMSSHWEFAYGPRGFKTLAAELDYPVLAINVYDKATGELFFPPYRVVERGGLRVGIVGLACPIVDKTMPPAFSEGLRFTLGRDELPGWIERLRTVEAVDLVAVLSHLGLPQDLALARDVAGIDVLLSGHTHNRMYEPIVENGAIVFQSGCHGSFIGRLDLEFDGGCVVGHRHRLLPVDDGLPEDASVRALVDDAVAPHRALLGTVVGRTERLLHRYAMLHTDIDDLLLDAIAAAAGTEIAFSNGWRYGAPIAPGPITLGELWNIIPTDPPVSTVELTGAEIVAMLEDNLERTFAADPYEQMGGYVKRCRGLTLYAKVENPVGHRIDRLFVGDGPVEPERRYRCAYVTAQGVPRRYGRDRVDLPVGAIDALRSWLAMHPAGTATRDSVIAV